MKTQINKYSIVKYTIVIIAIIFFKSTFAQTYFHDNVVVPIFEGTIIPNLTTKFDYWDLGEVNTQVLGVFNIIFY